MESILQYRRQFILTRRPIIQLTEWACTNIGEYYLYSHPDLAVNQAKDTKKTIVLIGNIYDSVVPEKENADIIKDISDNGSSIEELVLKIKPYTGNYAIFYKNDEKAIILHDARGLREVYYCTTDNVVVCGSQPNLVAKFANPEIIPSNNPDLLDFYKNHLKDTKWIGDETYYEGIKHLLPNHYLDIKKYEVRRYWPNEPLAKLDLDKAVVKSCDHVRGVIKAITNRQTAMLAVTAGIDSRTLLAASKEVQDRIYYFINKEGLSNSHPDISLPTKIFAKIGLPFNVHDVPDIVDEDFRKIFLSNTFFATDRILPTIYNVYYKYHSDKINILGLGELGRTYYGKEPRNLNSYRIAYKLEYINGCRYVIKQSDKILAELLPVARKYSINILRLLYWEQRAGNWGAVGNSESDIAFEEIDPYNSHALCEVFLAVDEKYTDYSQSPCVLFKEMIRHMWPELLEWPINPPYKKRDKIIWNLKQIGIYSAVKELKYQVNYLKYLIRTQIL